MVIQIHDFSNIEIPRPDLFFFQNEFVKKGKKISRNHFSSFWFVDPSFPSRNLKLKILAQCLLAKRQIELTLLRNLVHYLVSQIWQWSIHKALCQALQVATQTKNLDQTKNIVSHFYFSFDEYEINRPIKLIILTHDINMILWCPMPSVKCRQDYVTVVILCTLPPKSQALVRISHPTPKLKLDFLEHRYQAHSPHAPNVQANIMFVLTHKNCFVSIILFILNHNYTARFSLHQVHSSQRPLEYLCVCAYDIIFCALICVKKDFL